MVSANFKGFMDDRNRDVEQRPSNVVGVGLGVVRIGMALAFSAPKRQRLSTWESE
jgi:hypothetical protein